MAWSDAARRAALEARKMHSYAKRTIGQGQIDRARTAPHIRSEIARQIRLLRRGDRFASKEFKSDLYSRAAASSAAKRRQRRGKMPHPGTGGMSNFDKARLLARGKAVRGGRVPKKDSRFPSTHFSGPATDNTRAMDAILNSWKKGRV